MHPAGEEDAGLRAGGGCCSAVEYMPDVFVDHVFWAQLLNPVEVHIQHSDLFLCEDQKPVFIL